MSWGSAEYCSLANIFSVEMDSTSAAPYQGLTWLTFRDRRHALEKLVFKIRPKDFDPDEAFSADDAAAIAEYAAAFVTGEYQTVWHYECQDGFVSVADPSTDILATYECLWDESWEVTGALDQGCQSKIPIFH